MRAVRRTGADVLLVTTFLPRRAAARIFARRFAAYNVELRRIARQHGAILLDLEAVAEIGDLSLWADDLVHLRSRGHRLVAYRAAEALGVPDAGSCPASTRRCTPTTRCRRAGGSRGRPAVGVAPHPRPTAGDGILAKHEGYVELPTRGDRQRQRASS